ncbi:hypothetical protein AAU57_09490 [Nonlabens sp. YIK11]|uniref:hypothetical protein n=1 Tax=Nonlabens sp. YIK11 TaxID=1453349 RepID=UPI0006DCB451|nr:hypothetical protein [Nonlabens sp. YIK11]KQC33523.1 hypothetical protein AAU57_09490 [Nonlabens sp. YIK11]
MKNQLQGTWKRVDYPYSTYEFKGNTAKLISEGQYEEPQFDPYELSTSCRFADEFNTELASDELVLTNPIFEACSIVSVRRDTLRITDLERSFVIEYARN